MSVQGQISIALMQHKFAIKSVIQSSRPTHAAKIFTGKSIDDTLQLLPLLFNVCGKAQAITAVNAIESAMKLPADSKVQSQREALVLLESLREHSLRILIDWPQYVREDVDYSALAHVVQSINFVMQSLEPQYLLCIDAKVTILSDAVVELWQNCYQQLCEIIFGMPVEHWQTSNEVEIKAWAEQQKTQPARFITWLTEQPWKHAGASTIVPLPSINDVEFISQLTTDKATFVAQPNWQSRCYELSWFNYQYATPLIAHLTERWGNGIYTRMIARLNEVADLIIKLQDFFQMEAMLNMSKSTVDGLAHTHAARGRLSHYVELEGHYIKQLSIIAPTEWNFHPHGVAADSLCHLNTERLDTLHLQADLIIHAIDPCVEYQLHIKDEVRY